MNLVESLVAFGIAAVLAGAALTGSADSAREVQRDRAHEQAVDLTEDLVERLAGSSSLLDALLPPGDGERSGELDLDLALGVALVPQDEAAEARRTLAQAGVRAIRVAWVPALPAPRERLASIRVEVLGPAGPIAGTDAVRLFNPGI